MVIGTMRSWRLVGYLGACLLTGCASLHSPAESTVRMRSADRCAQPAMAKGGCQLSWYKNRLVTLSWGEIVENKRADGMLFIVGAQDPLQPMDLGDTALSQHDYVVPAPAGEHVLSVQLVQAGPKAEESNLRQRWDSKTGRSQPYQLRFDQAWIPITTHQVIEMGIVRGLLKLKATRQLRQVKIIS